MEKHPNLEKVTYRQQLHVAAVLVGAGALETDINRPSDASYRPLSIWHSVDAFAFGVVLWQVLRLCGPPWKGLKLKEMWMRVQRGERPAITAADVDSAPEGYVALMRELWHQDPVARPTVAEALRHKTLHGDVQLQQTLAHLHRYTVRQDTP